MARLMFCCRNARPRAAIRGSARFFLAICRVLAQAAAGVALKFRFIALEEAVALERSEAERRKGLGSLCFPLIRDPRTMSNLLSYQLISGAIAGEDDVL